MFLVNRKGGLILGREAFTSVTDLPEPPELVVITVPAAGVEEAVDDSLEAGAKGIVLISAGLGEMGEEGAARERAIVERVRAAGAVLVGPNCLGIHDSAAQLELCSEELEAGSIGLISQSGNLALEIGMVGAEFGLGFSRFVSLGNQADVQAAELIQAFAEHEPTQLIAVYLEDFRDGREFARAGQAAVEAGTPVVLLAGGATEASARAARSHTGALASDLASIRAACLCAGIELVASPKEVVDVAMGLLSHRRPKGRRIALAADGGGHTVVASDLVIAEGLELPELTDATRAKLAEALPPTATLVNPVDFAGGGEQDIRSFERVIGSLLRSGEVDTVILTGYFGGYSQYSDEFEESEKTSAIGMARAAEETGVPFLAHTMYWRSGPAQALRENGVPVYRDVEAAVGVASRLARRTPDALLHVPELPQPAAPLEGEQDYYASREVLADAGIPFAAARRVSGAEEAVAVAADIGYPVVLKALGELHKSDSGASPSAPRPRGAERRARADAGGPRSAVLLRRGDGAALHRSRADRRRQARPALRADPARRRRRAVRRDRQGRRRRPRARDGGSSRGAAALAAGGAALDGARGRPAVNVAAAAAAAAALYASPPSIRRSPRSRSTRSSRCPTARWGSMPVSSSADARRRHTRRQGRDRHGWRLRPRPCNRPRARAPRRRGRRGRAEARAARGDPRARDRIGRSRPRRADGRARSRGGRRLRRGDGRRARAGGRARQQRCGQLRRQGGGPLSNGWRAVVSIVLDGGFLCSRASGKQMIEQGDGGSILSVIASYAWTGGSGTIHSAAAKAGLVAMTKTLAVEWAPHGIRANCICPGPTDTEGAGSALWPTEEDRARVAATVPLGRLATPHEVAVWATALCSDYAGYITGETLTIDGGHWLEQESYMPALKPRD